MGYHVTFKGRWQGPVLHAFADLDPSWDETNGITSVTVADHPALLGVMNRASDLGLIPIEVRSVDVTPHDRS
jgi:hypothetical protein